MKKGKFLTDVYKKIGSKSFNVKEAVDFFVITFMKMTLQNQLIFYPNTLPEMIVPIDIEMRLSI